MTDLEKVMNGLSICSGDDPDCQNCPYYGEYGDGFGCETIMQRDALSLLKAQEPVNPLVAGRGESFETAEAWWYECGNCGGALTLDDKYCRKCGQAVKWE